jgi:hypothetical protein
MDILELKEIIHNKRGISTSEQYLIFQGRQLENHRSIGDYYIQNGDIIHLRLAQRGGMYHFTSGRSDFNYLPYDTVDAVKTILNFNDKDIEHAYQLSSVRLQEFILQGRTLLLSLYRNIQQVYIYEDIPDLKNIILPTTTTDDEDSEDDDMSTTDE